VQIRPVTIAIPAAPCHDCEEPGSPSRPGDPKGGSNRVDPAVALTGAEADQVILSDAARRRAVEARGQTTAPGQLTEEERQEVRELRKRDREVRAHEEAHLAAAGPHAKGGARYETTTGPDGRRYATSGEVSIDATPVPGDPQATLQKAQEVRRAALAPADPSAQDLKVAAKASRMAAEARAELARERSESDRGSEGAVEPDPSGEPRGAGGPDESADAPPGLHPLAARFSQGPPAPGTPDPTGASAANASSPAPSGGAGSPGDDPGGSILLVGLSGPEASIGRRLDVTT